MGGWGSQSWIGGLRRWCLLCVLVWSGAGLPHARRGWWVQAPGMGNEASGAHHGSARGQAILARR